MGKTTAKKVAVTKEEEPIQVARSTGDQYLQKAKEMVILNEDDYSQATQVLVQIKNAAELAELEKNKVLLPAKQVVKAETARWKPIEDLFAQVNNLLRPKMKKFLDDREEKARQDLAKLNKQIESGQIKKAETIERKENEILSSVPAKTVHTGGGSASARKVAKLEIVDSNLIPDEYWIIDEVKLRRDVVTNDKVVPGAKKVYENSISII